MSEKSIDEEVAFTRGLIAGRVERSRGLRRDREHEVQDACLVGCQLVGLHHEGANRVVHCTQVLVRCHAAERTERGDS